MTTDLSALLGDRYEAVLDCADEALQGVCGRPNSCWKHGHWDDAEAVLAAVLPDLLAAAWGEGVEAMTQAVEHAREGRRTEARAAIAANPYRSEDPR